ncbi:competence protein CoiA [Chitinophaga pinensis]|uniref:Competence protein n=1 Tax=Chitinophaga pinensis (strain ATCC 43595 / DSM 2588 / LMG 13176 / NBRC 15968 / NCIMB 11800 / UQM 2034) TaxID=485918 RepID=A0A979G465_CHIPD|nr:competence protein CoiA family protein [Chitinophaga pinensis]ACU60612.1 putative competence protein [Chitinophaga pinensis DSM 2588]
MRLAYVNNKLTPAAPKLKGTCPGCTQPVTAKCGTKRIHHWAHQTTEMCDRWWEPETAWHRAWKNNFPLAWQEVFLPDERTDEKHIADLCTSHGLTIEFQHSAIDPEERASREAFYHNLIWVVDGTRLKGDFPRFLGIRKDLQVVAQRTFRVNRPDEYFPSAWVGSSVPVFFDFWGDGSMEDNQDVRNSIYCLFPTRIGTAAILVEWHRSAFIEAAKNGKLLSWVTTSIHNIKTASEEEQLQRAKLQQQQERINYERFSRMGRYPQRRRRF